jgi:hypothetical protein
LVTSKWGIEKEEDVQLIQYNVMKIAKFCMLNELEISTVLYLYRQHDFKTISHKGKGPIQEKWQLLQGLYYLVLYVKECLSESETFKDLLEGQKTFDLYSINYIQWKGEKLYNLDYFNIDLKTNSALKKINEELSKNLRLKNKQNSGHQENMNDLVKSIISTSNPKGNHYGAIKFEENDPMRFVNSLNADVKGLCDTYDHNVLLSVERVESLADFPHPYPYATPTPLPDNTQPMPIGPQSSNPSIFGPILDDSTRIFPFNGIQSIHPSFDWRLQTHHSASNYISIH